MQEDIQGVYNFLIALYSLINVIVTALTLVNFGVRTSDSPSQDCALPYRMHRASKMNWFGCWVCSLLIFIPLSIPYILQVAWWLFHIKREK